MSELIAWLSLVTAAALLLWDLLSLLFGWVPSVSRSIYYKVRGYIEVPVPDDLHTAWANGLIRKDDELLVGYQHEGNEERVTHFAVSPELVGRPVGSRLRVVGIRRRLMVLSETKYPHGGRAGAE